MDRKEEILKEALEKFDVEHSFGDYIDDYTKAYDAIYSSMETYAREREKKKVIEELEKIKSDLETQIEICKGMDFHYDERHFKDYIEKRIAELKKPVEK